jgi:hypothetical protein
MLLSDCYPILGSNSGEQAWPCWHAEGVAEVMITAPESNAPLNDSTRSVRPLNRSSARTGAAAIVPAVESGRGVVRLAGGGLAVRVSRVDATVLPFFPH